MGRGAAAQPLYKILYVQVLIAILVGFVVGLAEPQIAVLPWTKALGDGFVKLIKMVITPIIFCTVVSGIAHISDARTVGRVAVKALIYFEIVPRFALVIGLAVGNLVQPGHCFVGKSSAVAVAKYSKEITSHNTVRFLRDIIPDSVVGAFASGNVLQVLLFAILVGKAPVPK